MFPKGGGGSKYKNIPTRSVHTGRLFQSKKEASREPALLALQNVGAIKDLRYQVPYRLEVYSTQAVDALMNAVTSAFFTGPHDNLYDKVAGLNALLSSLERSRHTICKYVADFVYLDENGRPVVEDVKGYRTPVYSLKRKLMLACHGVEIVEPSSGGVQQRARGAGVKGRGTGSRFKGGR